MKFSALQLSPGERGVFIATGLIAVAGMLVAVFAVKLLSGGQQSSVDLTAQNAWVCFCGAAGTIWATYLCRDWVGHSGKMGLLWAVFAAGAVTLLASIASGSLILPLYGTMFGPFSVIMTFISNPAVAIVWFSSLVAGHIAKAKWREERDTIFDIKLREPEPALRY